MSKGFIKRALPFLGTLVLGLFIASFFVDLTSPRTFKGHGRKHAAKRLKLENQELKHENLRLKNELEAMRMHEHDPQIERLTLDVPPLPPMPPAAPHHPRLVR